jgi:signal transduction histidine kinase/DNA-binding response OmpR family regulator
MRASTLKHQSLRLDLTAMAVIVLIIVAAAWLVYNGLKTQFLKANASDASNAMVFIDSELSNAQEQLALFAHVPRAQRNQLAQRRFETFSDLYSVDDNGEIKIIYKSSTRSRVFVGYAFTAGPVWQQLLRNSNVARLSSIVPGYEDGEPSVYVAYRDSDNDTIIGRLDLSYIQGFLNQYSRITGNVLLLTTDKGVVMISGRPDLIVPRIDVQAIDQQQGLSRTLTLDEQQWAPLVNESPALGAHLAVLVPTRLLDIQRNTMIGALVIVLLSLVLVVAIKHRSLNRKVLDPLNAIVSRIRKIEAGQPLDFQAAHERGLPTELTEINEHVQSMSKAIAERESSLAATADTLAKRESELSLILEHLPVPLIVFEPTEQQLITFTNASFLDALGYSTTEAHSLLTLFGHTCQDRDTALRVSQAIEEMIAFHKAQQKPADPVEVRIQCRSGIEHDFIISAISLQDTAIATLVDVTALRQSERALLEAKIKAEKQEREQSQFLAMMSHEIRTPLTSIVGITGLLAQDELSERQRDLVARLTDVNQLLLRIVNDVLDHSKIEAGELILQPFRFDLHELLVKCHRMFNELAANKQIALSLDVPATCAAWRVADAHRLEQVLSNLIGNALKFTEQGQVLVRCSCAQDNTRGDWVRIEVSDTGKGIPAALQPLIFEPYKQVEDGSVRQLGGTGLGLAISKRIIEAIGGEIGFNSNPEHGTTFWVELPLPLAKDIPTKSTEAPHTSSVRHLKGARVLVVDDSAAIQFLLSEMLSSAGLEDVAASDGQQALEQLHESEQPFDAVLMDIQMPNMGGIECTKAIRSNSKHKTLPIIAMTADLVGEQRQQIIDAGANALLEKPLKQDTLIQCLAQHIEATPERLFPHIDGIERRHAMHAMEQNGALFIRLLKVFLSENRQTPDALRQSIRNQDSKHASDQLSRLSASANQIGAFHITSIAEQIAKMAQDDKHIDLTLVDQIESELQIIEKAASAYIEQNNANRNVSTN